MVFTMARQPPPHIVRLGAEFTIRKVALSTFYDRCRVLQDGRETLPLGHWLIEHTKHSSDEAQFPYNCSLCASRYTRRFCKLSSWWQRWWWLQQWYWSLLQMTAAKVYMLYVLGSESTFNIAHRRRLPLCLQHGDRDTLSWCQRLDCTSIQSY